MLQVGDLQSGGRQDSALSQLVSLMVLGLQRRETSLPLSPRGLLLCVCPDFPLRVKTRVTLDEGPPANLVLTQLLWQRPYFPLKSRSPLLAFRIPTYLLRGRKEPSNKDQYA